MHYQWCYEASLLQVSLADTGLAASNDSLCSLFQ